MFLLHFGWLQLSKWVIKCSVLGGKQWSEEPVPKQQAKQQAGYMRMMKKKSLLSNREKSPLPAASESKGGRSRKQSKLLCFRAEPYLRCSPLAIQLTAA